MEKRYYLTLAFEDPKKDKTTPYGANLGAASEALTDLIEKGGPDGICHAVLVSTKKLIKSVAVYPKAWHKQQAEASQTNAAREQELARETHAARLKGRLDEVLAEAEHYGVADIVLPPAVPAQAPALAPEGGLVPSLDLVPPGPEA